MLHLYSTPNCPACMQRRRELVDQQVLFKYVVIGKDITIAEFMEKYPDVKSVPFLIDEPDPELDVIESWKDTPDGD